MFCSSMVLVDFDIHDTDNTSVEDYESDCWELVELFIRAL